MPFHSSAFDYAYLLENHIIDAQKIDDKDF